MGWVVGGFVLLWVAWGPVVPVVGAALLCLPRVRWWIEDRLHVPRRAAVWVAGVLTALVALVVVVPDGWLPVPPAPGIWSGPSYVGRPASADALATDPPQNPHRAATGTTRPGPLGLQPEVDTAWLGLQRCARLEPTTDGDLVGLCVARSGAELRMVDAETMRPGATRELAAGSGCGEAAFYLDDADRAVVATADRQVLRLVTTGDEPLADDATWDLTPYVPDGDCVVALAPDWSGRIWWASAAGLVGTIAPDSGVIGATDLREPVGRGIATDEADRAYVVTDEALHQLVAGADGTPQPVWRTEQSGTSGSAPVLLDGGIVALTDTVESRLGVVFLSRDTGAAVCRQSVFEKDEGTTHSDLAPLGRGVVVTNNHGTGGSTVLGFTSSPGIARVDLVETGCVVSWTSEAVSPTSGAVASWPTGLLYAWTKRPSLTGVSAWYLTALDAGSGRSMWSVRTGTGMLAGSGGSVLALGAGGSAWLGTRTGIVRVRDRDS